MISSSWHTLFVKKLKTENWILNWNKLNQLINNDEIIKIDFRPPILINSYKLRNNFTFKSTILQHKESWNNFTGWQYWMAKAGGQGLLDMALTSGNRFTEPWRK
jgi:hypothetical protein